MDKHLKQIRQLPKLARRRREAHKGDFGRVLVVGGSRGMVGAPALAAAAALRGGAGLVTMAAPANVQLVVAGLCPCATSLPLAVDEAGDLTAEAVRQFAQAAAQADSLAVGPGLAVGAARQNLIRAALEQAAPVVLDADGLNNLAGISDWPALRRCPLVLTPHPGEFARLTARKVGDIQADRLKAVEEAVAGWLAAGPSDAPPLVLALKGAGTVVTDGGRLYVNDTGNPGMATGGSGDVLTGLIAALIGQVSDLFFAACLGARLHGRAGDLAAAQRTETAMIASDLIDFLPEAMKEAVERS